MPSSSAPHATPRRARHPPHSLQTHKKKGEQITEPQVLKWLLQLTLALEYIHDRHSIIHRDLKTQNVFLMTDESVKLGDFGSPEPESSHCVRCEHLSLHAMRFCTTKCPQALMLFVHMLHAQHVPWILKP